MFATDYLAHAGKKEYSRHSFIKRYANQLRSAIPDLKIVEIKFLAQDNNTIVWQRTTKHVVKQYVSNSNVADKDAAQENAVASATKKIVGDYLIKSYVIAFYKSPEGVVSALAVMPYNIVKWGVSKTVDNYIKSPDGNTNENKSLWRKFITKKISMNWMKKLIRPLRKNSGIKKIVAA